MSKPEAESGSFVTGSTFFALSKFAVPALALLIALHQVFLRPPEASRWKGGGFGMYSEIHPSYYKVFVSFEGGTENMRTPTRADNIRINEIIADVQRLPDEDNLLQLGEAVQSASGVEAFTIQVWKPHFDPETLVYSRSLFIEKKFGQ